jgi:Type II secretion system (T2SS), protein E, N-terminal domain
MNYVETPKLLAALGPQPLWLHYQCIPVWEEPESLFVVSWATLDATAIEDLELIFGKPVRQIGMGERDELLTLIRAHAVDQPISELH